MPVCFHGRGRVRCGWGCALRFLAAWVDVILSCSFLLLLSYIVANVELLDVVRHDELLFRFLQPNLDKPLDADAYLRRAFHHFLVQLRALHVGEHLSRLFTFRLCRVRVFGGLAGVVNLVKAAARSPWRVRGVLFRFVVPVSQFLRRYAREGLIEFFLRDLCRAGCVSRFSVVKVASSSDSSMPFSIVAASCVGMAAVVRVDAILKRLLPMMSAFSAGTSSCAAMRLASFPSSDRHNPTMPLKKRTIRVSMMRS